MSKRTISIALVLLILLSTVYTASAEKEQQSELVYQWNLAVYSSKLTEEDSYTDYLQPSSSAQSDDPEIAILASSIVKDIDDDYEKARAVFYWVSGNIWYDWDCVTDKTKRDDDSAYATLQNRRGVCSGYSNLTVALLRAIGIPAVVAAGHAIRQGGTPEAFFETPTIFREANHVWTETYVGGRWIIMDATWGSNNRYKSGVYFSQRRPNEKYFDISLFELSNTHRYSLNHGAEPYPVIDLTIPFGVDIISDYAFWRNADLRSITLPDNVTAIGNAAFGHCSSLENIIMPDSIKSIGDFAFYHCSSLESVVVPEGVTEIGKYAFSGCKSLVSIYIPVSVKSIGKSVFFEASHVTITGEAGSYAQRYAMKNSILFRVGSPDDLLV